ncbi:MAG: hypothetical protein KAW12_17370 [Candidatus Aminicenantes bacterium]|nr:hypothetical protein [Candidatus Aminicenantes bacterium]
MEIVREFKRPVSQRVVLNIPEEFVKEELEILIIPVNKKRKKQSIDNKRNLFEKLCGLWEGRTDISLKEIRERAWKRA